MAKFNKSTAQKPNGVPKPATGAVKKPKAQQANKPAVAPAAVKQTAAAAVKPVAKPQQQQKQQQQQQQKPKANGKPQQAAAKPVAANPAAAAKKPAVAAKKAVVKREANAKRTEHSIFVGNLPPSIKRKTLVGLLKPHGTASSVRFRRTNGGKLFRHEVAAQTSIIAFVDLASAAEARAAVKALTNHKIGTHVLRADLQAGKSPESATYQQKCTAFVGNLPFATTEAELRAAFESSGEIEYVRVNQHKDKSRTGCSGTAFVCYKQPAGVVEALKLNGSDFNGRPLRISRSEKKQQEAQAKVKDQKPVADESIADEDDEDDEDEEDIDLDEEEDDEDDEEDDDDEDDDDDEEEDDSEDEPAPVPAKKSKPAPAKPAANKPKAAPAKNNNKKNAGKKF